MSDEEFDYMSDAFLVESAEKDIRPGLIHSRSVKRNVELSKKREKANQVNKDKYKPTKIIEKEKLQDGLQTPLSSENKGFAMLQKMGFKPGSGLGKTGEGRSEPIPVDIKTDRVGLGVKAHIAEIRAARAKKFRKAKESAPSFEDYRARIIEEANERQAGIDLYKSQRVCCSLDTKENVISPLEEWFWPIDKSQKETSEDEEENESEIEEEIPLTVQDKLEMITVYLRRTYFYCIWCGTRYDDEKDLQNECPGPTRNDH
ncbi:G patch domain-containing protein 11 [Halyomorpha halys]|uniref:G patch domain-containing protein 11 n=1 Tax=Halyomorpha halys TaxID=286706 RepID=UPI0006D5240C|nr:G patch domain-containing protein 11 [Halyomorpha halys]